MQLSFIKKQTSDVNETCYLKAVDSCQFYERLPTLLISFATEVEPDGFRGMKLQVLSIYEENVQEEENRWLQMCALQ
jgi:hypothetical protein